MKDQAKTLEELGSGGGGDGGGGGIELSELQPRRGAGVERGVGEEGTQIPNPKNAGRDLFRNIVIAEGGEGAGGGAGAGAGAGAASTVTSAASSERLAPAESKPILTPKKEGEIAAGRGKNPPPYRAIEGGIAGGRGNKISPPPPPYPAAEGGGAEGGGAETAAAGAINQKKPTYSNPFSSFFSSSSKSKKGKSTIKRGERGGEEGERGREVENPTEQAVVTEEEKLRLPNPNQNPKIQQPTFRILETINDLPQVQKITTTFGDGYAIIDNSAIGAAAAAAYAPRRKARGRGGGGDYFTDEDNRLLEEFEQQQQQERKTKTQAPLVTSGTAGGTVREIKTL